MKKGSYKEIDYQPITIIPFDELGLPLPTLGWYFPELAGLFLVAGISIGFLARLREQLTGLPDLPDLIARGIGRKNDIVIDQLGNDVCLCRHAVPLISPKEKRPVS